MVPAGTVHVPVRQFLGGRGTHLADLHLEVQVLTGERMIAVQRHQVAGELRDRDYAHALCGLRLQLHADAHVADALERAPWHALHQCLIVRAVALPGVALSAIRLLDA